MPKINRTRSFAKKNMRKKGNTSERREQMIIAEMIKTHCLSKCVVETENSLPDLVALEGADLTGNRRPKVDITVTFPNGRYAVRMNGLYHDERKQERKDYFQKLVLENQPVPWKVIDINESKHDKIYLLKEPLHLDFGILQDAYLHLVEVLETQIPMKPTPNKKVLTQMLNTFL